MHNYRPPPGRALFPVLLAAVAGPALQVQQAALWGWPVYAGLVGLGLLAMAGAFLLRARAQSTLVVGNLAFVPSGERVFHPPPWAPILVIMLATAAVAFGSVGLRAAAFSAQALPAELEGRDVRVTGIVASMPQRTDAGQRFRLAVESAQVDGAVVHVPRLLALAWYGGPQASGAGGLMLQKVAPGLKAGDRWTMTVRLRAPHGSLNPHGFDQELWWWEHGLQATGYVRAGPKDPAPMRVAATWRHPVEQARQSVRDAILARIEDPRSAGVVAALVVGDQAAIDRADWDVFRATGVAHLMSISGLHVTMFAWAAALAIGSIWRRSTRLCLAWPAQHAALLGGLLLAVAYALFSGWGVPAQRTLWMLAAVAWLRLSGRQWPWPALWAFACAVVVTVDPWALMQPGFWLSFVAVGVLFATDIGLPAGRLAGRAVAMLREQVIVTLALAPLTLLLFGQVSVVGLLANLLAIPWVTLVVTPLAMAGVLVPPLWQLAAWAVQALGWLLDWLAQWPWAVASGAAPALWAGVAGVLGGALLVSRFPPALRALGIPLLLPVMLWQVPRPAAGEFELLAADVGQGNAVVVRTRTRTLVYDAGPRYGLESDAGHRVLVPLLRALGERVDTLMLSHRDADHTGGAAALLATHPGAALIGSLEPGHELGALRPVQPCLAGDRWSWDAVSFEVLHPRPADVAAAGKPNTMSCVLRISNGKRTALLAGDIELAQESRLVREGADLRADVLLVPHHGSKTSSSSPFVDAVRPSLALVQAGYRNRFGHPTLPVTQRLEAAGARVIESARCGAAWWSSAAPERLRCEREAAPRYWHHRLP